MTADNSTSNDEQLTDNEIRDALLKAFQTVRENTGVMRVPSGTPEWKVVYKATDRYGPKIEYFVATDELYDERVAHDYVGGTLDDVAEKTGCRITKRGWHNNGKTVVEPDDRVVELIETREDLEDFLE